MNPNPLRPAEMHKPDDVSDDEILPEYTLKGGVRGKYAARRFGGSNLEIATRLDSAAPAGGGSAPGNARVVKSSAKSGIVSRAAARAAAEAVAEFMRRDATSSGDLSADQPTEPRQ